MSCMVAPRSRKHKKAEFLINWTLKIYGIYQATAGKLFYFQIWPGMVFCFQNCSDLMWEKNSSEWEKLKLKFETEGQEFANFWDH